MSSKPIRIQLNAYPQPVLGRWVAYCQRCTWAQQFEDIDEQPCPNGCPEQIIWLAAHLHKVEV